MPSIRITRLQAYRLAWSKPMQELAAVAGMSNVAFAKNLKKVGVPVPKRGYWNKLAAGKPAARVRLPEPDLGTADTIYVRGDTAGLEDLIGGAPGIDDDPPSLEVLTERFRARIGRIVVPRSLRADLARLVAIDDRRAAKAAELPYHQVYQHRFRTPTARRRLRIAGALLEAADRFGQGGQMEPEAGDTYPSVGPLHPRLEFGDGLVRCRLVHDNPKAEHVLSVYLFDSTGTERCWKDTPEERIEDHLTEIVVTAAQGACQAGRSWAERLRKYEVEQAEKRELERLAAERAAAEQALALKRLEERRQVRALVRHANDMQRAETIRAFVASVYRLDVEREAADAWVRWALAQADAIDPLKNGLLLASVQSAGSRLSDVAEQKTSA